MTFREPYDTLLRCTVFSRPATGLGQKRPTYSTVVRLLSPAADTRLAAIRRL
jgi:hypothetical protein